MANTVSALKRVRQTKRKTTVNRANKSRIRGSLRLLREALVKGDATVASEQYKKTVSRARQERPEGCFCTRTRPPRYKSRLNARVKALTVKAA